MPTAKQSVTIASAANVPAGTTAASPVTTPAVDVRTFLGGEWGWKITNVAALGAVPTLILQTSDDGTDWVDTFRTGGASTGSGDVTSGSITMSSGVMYARVLAYGNTTGAVTVSSKLQARVS